MEYTALKKCRISGINYAKGDIITSDRMSMYEGQHLERMGVVAAYSGSSSMNTIILDDRLPALDANIIKQVMIIIQEKQADAIIRINEENDATLLNTLMIFDNRKTIQTACSDRLTDLTG